MNKTLFFRGEFARQPRTLTIAISLVVLLLASQAWRRASFTTLALTLAAGGVLLVVQKPQLGLIALVPAALSARLEISTGTEVKLNPATLLVPVLLVLWVAGLLRRHSAFRPSPANLPLLLFLAASLLSLLIGRATWDLAVPMRGSFLLVQLAQWAIFAFSAGAFWLAANLIKDERWLWRLTAAFLLVGGGLAILRVLPGVGGLVEPLHHHRLHPRALLDAADRAGRGATAVQPGSAAGLARLPGRGAGRQPLSTRFVQQQEAASNWVGLAAVLGTLLWLRFPRLRWPMVILVVVLIAAGRAGSHALSVRGRRRGVGR